jgi:hypothetical protein
MADSNEAKNIRDYQADTDKGTADSDILAIRKRQDFKIEIDDVDYPVTEQLGLLGHFTESYHETKRDNVNLGLLRYSLLN